MDIQLHAFNGASNKMQLAEAVSDEHRSGPYLLTCTEIWRQSREAVFDLFAEYFLTSEQARFASLHSKNTLGVLFNLLVEPGSKRFALCHILDLLKLPPISEEDQEAKLELCIKYLETLSQSHIEEHDHEVDILVDMLGGICEVLQTDLKYYQALFREGECFVHIVTVLNE
eukprot:c36576_g1_i1 orf=1-513(+)